VEQLIQRIAASLRDGECLSGLTSLIAPDRVIWPGKHRIRHFDQPGAGRSGVAEMERDHSSLVARLELVGSQGELTWRLVWWRHHSLLRW
jgi:hypothetical protein